MGKPRKARYLCATALFALAAATAVASCFTTPKAALDAGLTGHWRPSQIDAQGYKLITIQSDPLLSSRWARIASCSHPDWPLFNLPVSTAIGEALFHISAESPVALVVHAGDAVRLWRRDEFVHMDLYGLSEDSGSIGSTVTVRIPAEGSLGAAFSERKGIVRGAADVELLPW